MLCSHYRHWCKSVHPTTKQPVACRHCYANQDGATLLYDEPEFDRFNVSHMQCSFCYCFQTAGPRCVNPECTMSNRSHRYYCEKCHLWEDNATKHIYHCDQCGICRMGRSEDYTHCNKCNMCVSKRSKHQCVGGLAKDNPCPICYTDIAQSTDPAVFLKCGHAVHRMCLTEWQHNAGALAWYTGCPICRQR